MLSVWPGVTPTAAAYQQMKEVTKKRNKSLKRLLKDNKGSVGKMCMQLDQTKSTLDKVNEMLAFYLQTTVTFQLVCVVSNILTFLLICIISPSRYIYMS